MIKVLKIRSCKRLKVLLINTTEEEDDSRLLACNLSFNNVRPPSFFLFLVIWVPEWPLRKTPYVTFEIEINKLILLLLFFMLFLRSWTRNWLEMIRIKAFMVWVSYHTIESLGFQNNVKGSALEHCYLTQIYSKKVKAFWIGRWYKQSQGKPLKLLDLACNSSESNFFRKNIMDSICHIRGNLL